MKALLTTALSGAFAAGAWAADAQPAAPETEAAKLNYSLGYQIGQDFKRQGVELSADVVTRGVDDALSGAEPALAPLEMRNILRQLKRKIVAQQAAKAQNAAQKLRDEAKRFMDENARKEGVTALPSGLQYKVIQEGTGRHPSPRDRVTVHYRASLADGTEFDSSHEGKAPITFGVDEVIAGWQEGLQLMAEGAHYRLFVPPSLGYAEGSPLEDRTVILDVELLKVEDAGTTTAAEPQQGGTP